MGWTSSATNAICRWFSVCHSTERNSPFPQRFADAELVHRQPRMLAADDCALGG